MEVDLDMSTDINEISFPDEEVIEWRLLDSTLEIRVSGAYLGQKIPAEVIVRVSRWRYLMVREFNHEDASWSVLAPNSDHPKELCEFEPVGESLSIRGFGNVSGRWVEWKFDGAEVCAELASSNTALKRTLHFATRPLAWRYKSRDYRELK